MTRKAKTRKVKIRKIKIKRKNKGSEFFLLFCDNNYNHNIKTSNITNRQLNLRLDKTFCKTFVLMKIR